MPRMPRHTVHDAPSASRETLATLEKQSGKLLNIHAHMGHAPVVLEAYAGIRRAIDEHGTFDKRTREGRPVDPRLDPLLAVVGEAAEAVGTVEEETSSAAVKAGWSETELAEAFARLAVNLYTNSFNHFAGTDLDVPAAPGVEPEAGAR